MKTTFTTCTLAAALAMGSSMSASAADVIKHAGFKFVVSDEPQRKQTGKSFETAGVKFIVPASNKADSDLAALENADSYDSLIWSDDDPDIVLIGK